MNEPNQYLPVLSLLVAVLAVFVGPLISWAIAKRQIDLSFKMTNKQIVAPMRQAWINSLRDLMAEFLAKSVHYWAAGYDNRTDKEYLRMEELQSKLHLMINPKEEDHNRLKEQVKIVVNYISSGNVRDDAVLQKAHKQAEELTQTILKKEWDRVRTEM